MDFIFLVLVTVNKTTLKSVGTQTINRTFCYTENKRKNQEISLLLA
jgi:hypothetical protein